MLHSGAVEGPEWDTPMKSMVQTGSGEEAREIISGAEEEREVTARSFSTYGRPLEMVTSFIYLGWLISETKDDWPEMVRNLSRERAVWKRMTQILSR